MSDFRIYKADNNLDEKDNLDELPEEAAVYAISGRKNGTPANCRLVNYADNLREAIKRHFSTAEPQPCLRQFMQSIKIKTVDYLLMPGASEEEVAAVLSEWKTFYKPECNEQLNQVF
ncbi:hypothetical protein HF329_16595 [Chitinophaga oryzae]|uniref:Uncharacterized protein n=1 Tax=Chitinophaga oryzae TaxID=2725414 RepID=A0AAE6ZJ31_9BACT|nr:hypothetical protein [Chitinophaga oryzae]QJB32847.1 hypothetical protein HF329_16595 [Chitinophaga oryzae]